MGFLYNKIMKKFLVFVLCFFCALPLIAQGSFDYSAKILLKQDTSAEIRETLTFYSDYEIELPVLKRDIETDVPLKKITMSGNLMYLNFTADRSGNITSVRTLMNPFSRKGKNTVTLS